MATTAIVTTYQIQGRALANDNSFAITITGMSGATTVKVNIYFVKTGKPIPPPAVASAPLLMETYMPEASFPYWVDLLRNEKPLTLYVNGTAMYVQTGQEPAGAAEIGG